MDKNKHILYENKFFTSKSNLKWDHFHNPYPTVLLFQSCLGLKQFRLFFLSDNFIYFHSSKKRIYLWKNMF